MAGERATGWARAWSGSARVVRGQARKYGENGVTRERWGQRLREALQREARGGRAGLVAIEGLPTWDPPQQLEFSAQWADGVVALGSQGGQVAVARWEPHSSRSGGNWRPAGLAEEATGGPVIGLDWVRSSPGVLLTAWSGAGSGPDEGRRVGPCCDGGTKKGVWIVWVPFRHV